VLDAFPLPLIFEDQSMRGVIRLKAAIQHGYDIPPLDEGTCDASLHGRVRSPPDSPIV
jgi:hypothetical protein